MPRNPRPHRAHRRRHARPRTALAVAVLLLAGWPAAAWGQASIFRTPQQGVGTALWYGWDRFSIEAAPTDAPAEVQAYTDVLPGTLSGRGPALGVSFRSFGINIGLTEFRTEVGKVADLNRNGTADVGDVYVIAAERSNVAVNVIYQPVRGFYLGYGRDVGTMTFQQTPVGGGVGDTRRLSYRNDFYTFGFGLGFDPTQRAVAPVFALYGKVPVSKGEFNGRTYGAGIGVYF